MTSAVVVGSGPNGLAAALTLAAAGVRVRVIEAADTPGGGTRSAELTLPGLLHDECSAFHPLAVDTPFSRAARLDEHGLEWCWPEIQYAHPLDGSGPGDGASAWRSAGETAADLGPDGAAWQAVFGELAERLDRISEDLFEPMLSLPHHPRDLALFGTLSALPASLLARRWRGERARALFAGVAAHGLRPFGAPMSSAIGVTLGAAAHRYGWPAARGGSQAIARAMVSALESHGGVVETGRTVTSLDELGRPDIVMLDTAPAGASRIAAGHLPPRVDRALRRYRHGPAAFKVELAVAEGVPWRYEPARRAGTVHLGGSLEEIATAERLVSRGQMPERPFVLVGQQYLADPGRSRDGVHPVYAYAHVPSGWSGDATALVEAQIERFAPGFGERVLARHVRDVAGMSSYNANYVGGDIVTGANTPRQLVARPRVALDPYWLGSGLLYLCSAATPPGGGAHGMCGFNAAQSALARLTRTG